jgi:hypothetical protein
MGLYQLDITIMARESSSYCQFCIKTLEYQIV